MIIRPSTSLRNEYNDISRMCKEKQEPVYITKNGEGDLVVMDIEAFERREKLLDLRERLLESERQRLTGARTYTPDEFEERMKARIHGA